MLHYFWVRNDAKFWVALTRRIEEPIASAAGEDSHVVRFLLPVSNMVVFEQTVEKLSIQAHLALAFTSWA